MNAVLKAPAAEETFLRHEQRLERSQPMVPRGKVTRVIGLVIESNGPDTAIGEACEVLDRSGRRCAFAEVVGFRDHHV
ncbi:MAG TPA: hypothetical protein ENI92_05400, partial [Bacteroidetes bacterium]|nr:hypothetical protein [Bacteroidota bacterium]